MKEIFDLEFCFKGNRNYIHGTDIFTKLAEKYDNVIKIDIAFHGISVDNMSFFSTKPNGKELKVTFKCQHDSETIKLFGIENGSMVNCRYEYLEEKIVENSTVDISQESIILNIPAEYSFIEHIVAMNKALVEKIYSEVNGKWYFTRLQLSENIRMSDISSLKLTLQSNFQFKLTKSVIVANGKELGFIYFSLIPKES